MVKHIVAWNFKSDLSEEDKSNYFERIKHDMESLAVIDGVIDISVYPLLKTSTRDLVLVGTYESIEVLETYANHPLHKEKQAKYIDILCDREAIDYVMD